MTFRVGDRVRIATTVAPGTGAVNDANAAVGYGLFGTITSIANGDTVPYTMWDGAGNWECGHATYTTGSPATLTRTTIIRSSNANAIVNFAASIVYMWCSLLAEDAIIGTPTGTGAPVLQNSPTITGNALMNQVSNSYDNVTVSTGATTIDLSLNSVYNVTMGATTTFTFINCPNNSGYAYQFFMYVKQNATGGFTPTFPASVKFPTGVAPSPTLTANLGDLYAFITFNGGTTYIGFLVAPDVAA